MNDDQRRFPGTLRPTWFGRLVLFPLQRASNYFRHHADLIWDEFPPDRLDVENLPRFDEWKNLRRVADVFGFIRSALASLARSDGWRLPTPAEMADDERRRASKKAGKDESAGG